MIRRELEQVREEFPRAIGEGARYLIESYRTSSSVAELADAAWDQIETTCYLTDEETSEAYAALTYGVFMATGVGPYMADSTEVPLARLERIARVKLHG